MNKDQLYLEKTDRKLYLNLLFTFLNIVHVLYIGYGHIKPIFQESQSLIKYYKRTLSRAQSSPTMSLIIGSDLRRMGREEVGQPSLLKSQRNKYILNGR